MSNQSDERTIRTYAGWFNERRVYAFGLTPVAFGILGAVVIVALAIMFLVSVLAALVVGGIGLLLWFPLTINVAGKSAYEALFLTRQWGRQQRKAQHIYRAGPLSNQAGGRARLPGIGTAMELWWALDKFGNRFGIVRMLDTHQYTVVLRCRVGGAAGNDQELIDSFVGSWANFLAALGQIGNVAAMTVTVETLPETGERVRANISAICDPDAPAEALAIMAERLAAADNDGQRVHSRISITFDSTSPAQRKDPMMAAAVIGNQLPVFYQQLAHCNVTALPMTDHEISAVVRRAYAPEQEADIESALARGDYVCDWADAGPITAEETKDTYLHDAGASRVWVMRTPPSGFPTERVLVGLLSPNASVPRKRITLIYRPYSPGDATKTVEGDFKSAVAKVNTARGIVAAEAEIEIQATQAARRAEARGHGLVRLSMVVTATCLDEDDLDALEPDMKALAAGARLNLRPAYRHQAAAFLSGLGIGVLLPDHATIPKTLRA
ncbi:hypothetical protein BH93_27485 (plasmid) [Rhodococcoides fascians A25f]|uniref:SCO6880 family protein n=1 Tax=Rhodococcoides fascians TaxID=1828 RepID=UPI00056110C7|nr:SCO6880 family protein [Rhodococcus fascians]QII09315.1 hypothetical protein BH93_27485 [Rhodococcus fascians A25f]